MHFLPARCSWFQTLKKPRVSLSVLEASWVVLAARLEMCGEQHPGAVPTSHGAAGHDGCPGRVYGGGGGGGGGGGVHPEGILGVHAAPRYAVPLADGGGQDEVGGDGGGGGDDVVEDAADGGGEGELGCCLPPHQGGGVAVGEGDGLGGGPGAAARFRGGPCGETADVGGDPGALDPGHCGPRGLVATLGAVTDETTASMGGEAEGLQLHWKHFRG